MTSVQKIALSFLMTLVLFAGFLLTFNSYLFDFLEAKFYSQARILEKTEELNQISQGYNEYFTNFLSSINDNYNSWKNLESVRSFYEPNPSEVNVAGRRIANERLFRLYTALSGIRLIDKNGKNVHYSSFDDTDILKQSGISKIYKNYPDICKDSDEILFENFEKLSDEINSRILFDDKKNRIIICEPFFYSGNIFSGYALFYFDFLNLQKELIEKEYLEKNYSLSLFSDNELSGGIADGILNSEKEKFKEPLLKIWENQTKKTESQTVVPEKIFKLDLDENNEDFLVVLTNSCDSKINVSGVYNSIFFEIPKDLQFVIYLCIFISLFLILFLIFSFKRDSMSVLNKKVKKLQLEIMQDCLEKGEKIKLDGVFQKLLERRNEISTEILKSLKIRSKKQSQEIENLLEKNWDEIFDFFKSQNDLQNNQNFSNQNAVSSQNLSAEFLQEIKSLLQEVLQNTELKTISTAAPQLEKIEPVDEVEEVEEVEDIDEIEEVEEVEENLNSEEKFEDLEELAEEEVTATGENEDANEGLSPLEEVAPETELEDLTPLEEVEEVEEIAENLNSEEEFEDLEELAEEEVTATGENEDANEGLSPLEEVENDSEAEEELEELENLEELTPLEEVEDANEGLSPLEGNEDANEGLSPLDEAAPETELGELTPFEEVEEIAENLNSEEEFEDLEELAEEEVTATGENEDANEGLSPLEEVENDSEAEEELEELENLEELTPLEEVEDANEGLSPLDEATPETELEDLTPLEELTPLEDLTPLEEIPQIFNTEFLLKNQPKYEYTPSDETYFASENFATVDNVFAEEICLGSGIKIKDEIIPIEFKYFELKKYFENPSEKPSENQETTEQQIENQTAAELQNVTNQKETQSPQSEELQSEIEELSEEVPVQKEFTYYSMTNFAENLTDETPILDAAEIPENAIIEEDGVFSISQIKDYEKMGQDKDFKSLVDSIL